MVRTPKASVLRGTYSPSAWLCALPVLAVLVLSTGVDRVRGQAPPAERERISEDSSATVRGTPRPDRKLPSPADALGHDLGDRFTEVAEIDRYLGLLEGGSDRVLLRAYGRTAGGRDLVRVVLSAPETLASLDRVLARNRELTDPETHPDRAREIARTNPAVLYFTYGIHGDEGASSEAALWTAWDLARDAPEVAGVLDSLVVVIDPVANPDGRSRYVQWFRGARGATPDPDPGSWEHREPWPGGRYNHHLFDLNRDWAWMTQPETRARLTSWDTWNPQVHVDFHEMVETSTYFFFPASAPINPIYPRHVLEWGRRFGVANAAAFDRRGWPYFSRGDYDLFYPGYGDSWPSLLGSVGMTYEQAGGSAAGLVVDRPDGSRLTLEERARHHRVSGHATLRAARRGRSELLEGFAETHRSVDDGITDILLVPGDGIGGGISDASDDDAALGALVKLLRDQGIRVERSTRAFSVEATPHPGYSAREVFPAGTYRVRARQSRGRLASVLLRPDNPMDGGPSYDITAWSLPYAYGVEAHSTSATPRVEWTDAGERAPSHARNGGDPGARPGGADRASTGYLLRPEFGAAPDLVDFLESGGRAVALRDSFSVGGRWFPEGAVFLPRSRNEDLDERVAAAGFRVLPGTGSSDLSAARAGPGSGAPALPVAGGGAGLLLDPTSIRAIPLTVPRIALLGGPGTDATSFGAHRFFLERTLEIPFDVVGVRDVTRDALGRYEVVVAPGGGDLAAELGGAGLAALAAWVREGGLLMASDEGARALAGPVGGIEIRDGDRSERTAHGESSGSLNAPSVNRSERDEERRKGTVRGVVLAVDLDPRHPFAFGASARSEPHRMFILSSGHAFEPSRDFDTVARFPQNVLRVSGSAPAEGLRNLSRGSWWVDRRIDEGRMILFADDPLFRHFWYAGFQLVTNVLLFARSR